MPKQIIIPIGSIVMEENVADPADFGAVIRRARKAGGLTQAELALAAGVSLRFVSELERGKPGASIALALRIAKLLNVRIRASASG